MEDAEGEGEGGCGLQLECTSPGSVDRLRFHVTHDLLDEFNLDGAVNGRSVAFQGEKLKFRSG